MMSGDLKAATLGKDPEVALSKAWKVVKKHQGIYGGGKVEVSRDGKHVGCMFGEDVVLVDGASGQVSKVLSLGEGEGKEAIVSFTISPDANNVVTASRNLMIRYWDWRQGKCVRGYKAHETPVLAMEFDRTGTLLCTGSSDRTAKVWDVPGGFCTHNFRGHTGIITLVRFHPDPSREMLFTAADDTTVRVWSLAKQSCVSVLTHHMSTVTGLGVTEDGRTMVMAGRDQILSVWDVEGGSSEAPVLLGSLPVYDAMEGLAMIRGDAAKALCPQVGEQEGDDEDQHHHHHHHHHGSKGKGRKRPLGGSSIGLREGVVVVAGAKGVIKAYHFRSKADPFETGVTIQCIAEQKGKPYPRGYSGLVGGSLPRPWLLAVTSDHNLHYCDPSTLDKERVIIGFNDEIIDVRYLPHGRVAVATNSPQVRVLRVEDLSCTMQLEGPHTETVLSIDVSPDGRWLISGSKDRSVCLWELEDGGAGAGVCRVKFEGHTEAVGAVALMKRKHAYDTGIAAGFSAGGDRTIKRWAIQQRKKKQEQHGGDDGGGAEGEVRVVTEATATVLGHDKDINALAVAPNDALLASASQDKTVKLWDSKTLALKGVLKGHRRGVWSVDFSPIDRCVITGSADRTIKIWSLVDHSCLKTFEGHGASVLKTACVKNGLQLLSVSSDGLMKLWTVRSQECEATFDEHSDRVWALAISPDGTQVVTGGGDSVLNVWSDVTQAVEEEEIRLAEDMVQKEQALANYVFRKDYKKAIELAFELNRPLRLWKILQEVIEKPREGNTAAESEQSPLLDEYVREWDDEAVSKVLSYIRDWNTNAKHVMVAQTLLHSLFRLIPFDRLKRCCASKPAILDGLISYTERHLARADKILQSSYLVDFTLSSMHTLFGEDAQAQEEEEQGVVNAAGRGAVMSSSSSGPSKALRMVEPVPRLERLVSSSSSEDEEEEEERPKKGEKSKGAKKKKKTKTTTAKKEKRSEPKAVQQEEGQKVTKEPDATKRRSKSSRKRAQEVVAEEEEEEEVAVEAATSNGDGRASSRKRMGQDKAAASSVIEQGKVKGAQQQQRHSSRLKDGAQKQKAEPEQPQDEPQAKKTRRSRGSSSNRE